MYMGLAPSGCTEFKRTLSERIGTFCESAGEEGEPVELFRRLVADGLDRLPLPGAGNTIERWRALAAAAGHDLSLAKLFEGHTDALAILAELHAPAEEDGSRWAVWAAESRRARLTIARQDGQRCPPRRTQGVVLGRGGGRSRAGYGRARERRHGVGRRSHAAIRRRDRAGGVEGGRHGAQCQRGRRF